MKKNYYFIIILLLITFMGFGQPINHITLQVNPTLNFLKHGNSDMKLKPNINYSLAFHIMEGLMNVEFGYSKYTYKETKGTPNAVTHNDLQIENYFSHIGWNIGRKLALNPYAYVGWTDVLANDYAVIFKKYKQFDGSYEGRTISVGFGAKLNCYLFEPLFLSFGVTKTYPWMPLDLYDFSIMHNGSYNSKGKADVRQLCFELGIGYSLGGN